MKLHIITPTLNQDYLIVWIELETADGSFVVQPGHAPMILVLSEQKKIIFRLENGKQEEMMLIRGGIASISRTETLIIARA